MDPDVLDSSGRPLGGQPALLGLGQGNAGPACHAREILHFERRFYIERCFCKAALTTYNS